MGAWLGRVAGRGEGGDHQVAGAGRHDGQVEARDEEHEGDVLVEDCVQEPPSDQAVGEDEAGNTEGTEQQAELTELEHLWTEPLLSHTVSIYLHIGWLSQRTLPADLGTYKQLFITDQKTKRPGVLTAFKSNQLT